MESPDWLVWVLLSFLFVTLGAFALLTWLSWQAIGMLKAQAKEATYQLAALQRYLIAVKITERPSAAGDPLAFQAMNQAGAFDHEQALRRFAFERAAAPEEMDIDVSQMVG